MLQDLANPRYPKTRACLLQQGNRTVPSSAAGIADDCWCRDGECSGYPTGPDGSAAAALSSGTDLDCGNAFKAQLAGATSAGSVSAAQLDVALTRLFLNRFKTGEFDPAEQQPYRQIPPSAVNSPQHQQLALEAAREGLTLLKNAKTAGGAASLPFSAASIRTLAVIGAPRPNAQSRSAAAAVWRAGGPQRCPNQTPAGPPALAPSRPPCYPPPKIAGPNANCTQKVCPHGPDQDCHCNQLGNYATSSPFVVSPADGLSKFAKVSGCEGSDISTAGAPTAKDRSQFALAAAQAGAADATVLVMGMVVDREHDWCGQDRTDCPHRPASEGEGNDRPRGNAVPDVQLQLVEAVASATARAGKLLVVVVMAGGTLDLSPWEADPRIGAIAWVGYPGMLGGQALAEALFGRFSPSGRLPYSLYTDEQVRSMNAMRMDMRPDPATHYPGRTYRFNAAKPLFRSSAPPPCTGKPPPPLPLHATTSSRNLT